MKLFFFTSGIELIKYLQAKKERTFERRTGTRKEEVTVSAVWSSMRACQRYDFLLSCYFFPFYVNINLGFYI